MARPRKGRSKFVVPPALQPFWMSKADAQEALSKCRSDLEQMVEEGILRQSKYGRYVLINKEDVQAYLAQFIPVDPVNRR